LEGNTSFGGSQYNGGSLLRRGRKMNTVRKVCRPPYMLGNPPIVQPTQAPPPQEQKPSNQSFQKIERTGLFKTERGPKMFPLQLELGAICPDQGIDSEAAWQAERNATIYGPQTQWRVGLFIRLCILAGNRSFEFHPNLRLRLRCQSIHKRMLQM